LNVAPFHFLWEEKDDHVFIEEPPRRLGRMAESGDLDCAPLPIYDVFRLGEAFEPCGLFGIAAEDRVMSVLLFSRAAPEKLEGRTIVATGESSTSRALLSLLLRLRYGLRELSIVTEGSESAEPFGNEEFSGHLLIGDRALAALHGPARWPHCFDLATLWYEWTGLPFTFARWVVRRDLCVDARRSLERALEGNLARSLQRLDEVAALHSAPRGLAHHVILEYLRNFTYRLGPREEEGIRLFREMLKQCGDECVTALRMGGPQVCL
jgi:chorismate dehydratase